MDGRTIQVPFNNLNPAYNEAPHLQYASIDIRRDDSDQLDSLLPCPADYRHT